jgi:serralysin
MSTAFRAILEGTQEVPPNASTATGLGTVIFDSTAVAADYSFRITGVDYGPATGRTPQTPATDDDVVSTHFHNAPRGANGGVVFGQISPFHDNDDLSIVPNADGSWSVSGRWETTDPTTPANNIANFAGVLGSTAVGMEAPFYFNVHTTEFPGGEIRGQLVAISDDNDNVVEGTAGHDLLPGLGGNDIVRGLAGNDTILGGTGNDLLFGGTGNDLLFGGDGDDTIDGEAGTDVIKGDAGNDVITGGSGIDIVNAGEGDDIIKATIDDGHDFYYGDGGTDTVDYSALTERVDVRLGNLFGIGTGLASGAQSGVDLLVSIENVIGSQADDKITGNRQDNVIEGAGGNDMLTGGRGDDTLVFNEDFGLDTVTDFDDQGNDIITFSTAVFAGFGAVEGALSVAGRDVVITADAGNAITLKNTAIGSIGQDDFQFV